MKTKMSLEDRVEIVKMVLENRVDFEESIGARHLLETCPFDLKCSTCFSIFPKWGNMTKSPHKCPCGSMSHSYVKHRMKLLFPELY